MNNIKVDTTSLRKTASVIEKVNNEINGCFLKSQAAIKNLENSWSGENATRTLSIFSKIKKLEDSRYQVFDNYHKVLKNSVSEGYELTEQSNALLSDLFK